MEYLVFLYFIPHFFIFFPDGVMLSARYVCVVHYAPRTLLTEENVTSNVTTIFMVIRSPSPYGPSRFFQQSLLPTLPLGECSYRPISPMHRWCLSRTSALVNASAGIFSVSQYSSLILPSVTFSRTK